MKRLIALSAPEAPVGPIFEPDQTDNLQLFVQNRPFCTCNTLTTSIIHFLSVSTVPCNNKNARSKPGVTFFVEYRGVEPLTYRLRTYRSSQLS